MAIRNTPKQFQMKWIFRCLIATIVIRINSLVGAFSFSSTSRKTNDNPISTPSAILRAEGVYISYPTTWMTNIFSSVPRREYALEDLTLSLFENEVTLLVGASASGKSTLMRVLAGIDTPTNDNSIIDRTSDATPIILERKPDFDDSLSVLERLCEVAREANGPDIRKNNSIFQEISLTFCSTLGLTTDILDAKPSSLTPSEQFCFGIACGCIKSVANCNDDAPILFLDELLDFETSNVASKVAKSLNDLSETGAVVLISTHKPNMVQSWCQRKITLSGGKILTDQKLA